MFCTELVDILMMYHTIHFTHQAPTVHSYRYKQKAKAKCRVHVAAMCLFHVPQHLPQQKMHIFQTPIKTYNFRTSQ